MGIFNKMDARTKYSSKPKYQPNEWIRLKRVEAWRNGEFDKYSRFAIIEHNNKRGENYVYQN
ncbi:hypothetical protein ES703_08233 [subsurface metagenome]